MNVHDPMPSGQSPLPLRLEEVRTADTVAAKLKQFGLEVHRGLAKTGVVGVIKGQRTSSGRMVGLRADMDALPMPEDTDVEVGIALEPDDVVLAA